MKELGISNKQDEEVIDLTRLTFDEVNHKIVQENKKYCTNSPAEPLSVTMTKDIMSNITKNSQIITSTGKKFFATIEHNVVWMRKKIAYLQNMIFPSYLRATIMKHERRNVE